MPGFETHPLHPGKGVPFFIAAGVLKEPAQLESFMAIDDPEAAPVLTLGGYTLPAWSGNAKPGEIDFVHYPDLRMAGNARGLPNLGREGILSLKESVRVLGDLGIKTIIQVTNLPHEKPLDVIGELVTTAAEVEPTAIEVNLSCPNGKKDDGTFHDPIYKDADASGELMEAAREEVGQEVCLGAKDGPHLSSLEEKINETSIQDLALSLKSLINFLTGINTIGNQSFPEIICANGRGGMSGPVIASVAHQHQKIWREYAPNVAYLSCGGVETSNAAIEIPKRLEDGALLVGGAQEFYRAKDILDVLSRWSLKWAD